MKRPTKEQIEEIIKELPSPANYIGDCYEVAWKNPEDIKPINASTANKCADSYLLKLLFRKAVNENGHGFKWDYDEEHKSFDEFQAEQDQKPVDEYGIIEILKKHNAEAALNEITAVFDRFCEYYMGSREKIRKGAFTEVNCYLMTSLIEGREDAELLRSKITDLVDDLQSLTVKERDHANKAKQDTNSNNN